MNPVSPSNYWNANLGGPALTQIRAILVSERRALETMDANSSPAYLALYPSGNTPGKRNVAKVTEMIREIDEILSP